MDNRWLLIRYDDDDVADGQYIFAVGRYWILDTKEYLQ